MERILPETMRNVRVVATEPDNLRTTGEQAGWLDEPSAALARKWSAPKQLALSLL
jgi:hypothetical protein